ncbi:hypothetical protein BDZ89DRAFT_391525 [Hymenopellis radicata]|nr:hypothetical protein BDZ89DRAFT_391525 [Hymenopellis radicata]
MSSILEEFGLTEADARYIFQTQLYTDILFIFCHAIHTCVFFVALYYTVKNGFNRQGIVFVGIITFLWCSESVIVGLEWAFLNNLFIVHGATLDSKLQYALFEPVPGRLTIDVLRGLNVILADMVLIWRCWVLYGRNWKVVSVLSLFLIAETTSFAMILAAVSASTVSETTISMTNWVLAYYALTVATNSLSTFLIISRIVRFSNAVNISLKTYRGLVEILVESALLYSAIYICLIILYAYEFYSDVVFMGMYAYTQVMSCSITGIAPTLIIARVMAGQSRPNDSWTRPSLPHMGTNTRSMVESMQFASLPHSRAGYIDLEDFRHTPQSENEGSRRIEYGRAF